MKSEDSEALCYQSFDEITALLNKNVFILVLNVLKQ